MLEAKAKNQVHKRKCSPKKGLQKSFSGDLQTNKNKKGLQKFFSDDLQKIRYRKKIFSQSTKFLSI